MGKEIVPHVAHGPLADHARRPALAVANDKLRHQQESEDGDDAAQTLRVARQDVVVHGDLGQIGTGLAHDRGGEDQHKGQKDPGQVGPQITQDSRHQSRV